MPPTERFFRSLKHEQINYERFKTKESAKLSIIDYLAFYNGKRMPSNTAINLRSNMNGNSIRNLLNLNMVRLDAYIELDKSEFI